MTPSQSKRRAQWTSVARDIMERRDAVGEALVHLPEVGGAHAVMQGTATTTNTSITAARIILEWLASTAISMICCLEALFWNCAIGVLMHRS